VHCHPAGVHSLGKEVLVLDVSYENVVAAQTQESPDVSLLSRTNDEIIVKDIPCPIDLISVGRERATLQKFVANFFYASRHPSGVYHDKSENGLIASKLQWAIAMKNVSLSLAAKFLSLLRNVNQPTIAKQ
jgi:hypothetical protein